MCLGAHDLSACSRPVCLLHMCLAAAGLSCVFQTCLSAPELSVCSRAVCLLQSCLTAGVLEELLGQVNLKQAVINASFQET